MRIIVLVKNVLNFVLRIFISALDFFPVWRTNFRNIIYLSAHFNPTQEAKTNSWAFITSKNTSGGMAKPAQSVAVVNQKPIQQSPRDPPIPKPAEKIDMGPPGINRDGPKPPRDQREPRQQRPNREQRDNSRWIYI